MPSENEVCQAVLGFVTEGVYPEENVVAAEFPAAAVAKELELIAQARQQVEVSATMIWPPMAVWLYRYGVITNILPSDRMKSAL